MLSDNNTITTLISLLGHDQSPVRAAAAGALMRYERLNSISIDCDAKKVLVRENLIQVLGQLLSDENELVQLNAIKTITNCAEDYRGRFQLHQSIEKVYDLN